MYQEGVFSENRKTPKVNREENCIVGQIEKNFRKEKSSWQKFSCVLSLSYISAVTPQIWIKQEANESVPRSLQDFRNFRRIEKQHHCIDIFPVRIFMD